MAQLLGRLIEEVQNIASRSRGVAVTHQIHVVLKGH
jgi:hypothetical protein